MSKSEKSSYMLWLEILNQRSSIGSNNPQIRNIKQSNSVKLCTDHSDLMKTVHNPKNSHYKSQEEYFDEIILIKKDIVALKGENEILKCKLRKTDEMLIKKDKELTEVLNCFENQKSIRDSSVNNYINIKKLQQNIFQLKSEIKSKENEILNIKNEMRYTKLNEIKLQNETYIQEIRSLNQIKANLQCFDSVANKKILFSSSMKPSKSLTLGENYRLVLKKNKQLLFENKILTKEKNKLLQSELKKMESNYADKKAFESSEESVMEINRLKSQIMELRHEKNENQIKFENINSKNKLLQEKYESKAEECETLKIKFDKLNISQAKKELKLNDDIQFQKGAIKNYQFLQMAFLSYFNRQNLIQNISNFKCSNDSVDLIRFALYGYLRRIKLLNK